MLSLLHMNHRIRHSLAALLMVGAAGCATEVSSPDEGAEAPVDEASGELAALPTLEYDQATAIDGHLWQLDGDSFTVGASFGWGWYLPYGDYIRVYDRSADRMSVGIYWQVLDYGGKVYRRGVCVSSLGQNSAGSCNKNFPEGARMRMRVGRCDGSRVNCRQLSNWTSWSAWKSGHD